LSVFGRDDLASARNACELFSTGAVERFSRHIARTTAMMYMGGGLVGIVVVVLIVLLLSGRI